MIHRWGGSDDVQRFEMRVACSDEDRLRGDDWAPYARCCATVPWHLTIPKPKARSVRVPVRLAIMSPLYLCARCVEGCDHGTDVG